MTIDTQSDAQARERMLNDLDTTLLVEAAAGTGKTRGIVGRMVALLREGRARTGNIAAITFTIKASGELRRRFQDELEQAAMEEADEVTRQRLNAAIDGFDDITIGTIHSFCAQILRERPIEAGIAPGFTVLGDGEAASLRSAAWQRFIDELPDTNPAALDVIESIGVDFGNLESGYRTLCEWPEADFQTGVSAEPDLSEAVSHISALIDAMLPSVMVQPADYDGMQKALARASALLQDRRTLLRDARILSCFMPKDAGSVVQKKWRDKAEAKVLKEELFPQLLRTVIHPAFARLQIWRYAVLMPLLRAAAAVYAEVKHAHGALDNNDLLLRARNLLRDHPSVRTAMAARFTHVLVDEFQDTDPVQAELLLWLCSEAGDAARWRELRLRPGALFVVGDPKQSIYRFRRADISVYNDVRDCVIRSGGVVLELSRNFRSVGELCEAVNASFDTVFPEQADEFQPRNVRLAATRSGHGSLSGVARLGVGNSEEKGADVVAEAATTVARWISGAVSAAASIAVRDGDADIERPLRPSDVMVLTRYNRDLSALAEAMDRAGLPFAVEGGIPVGDQDELELLLILLRVLADPEDETAVVSWLRSAWCGVDDVALLQWRRNGGKFKLTTPFMPGMDQRIERGLLFIKNSMRLVRSAPPGAVVSAMAAEYGMLPALAVKDRGAMRAGVFTSLLALIRRHSTEGTPLIDIAAILEASRALPYAHGSSGNGPVLNVSASLRPDESGVRISTLHKAKGLEAPVVIVFTPKAFSREVEPASVIDRSGDDSVGWLRIGSGNSPLDLIAMPADWRRMQARELMFANAEEQRLRYVAMTRARDFLLLVEPAKGEGLLSSEAMDGAGIAEAPDFPPAPASSEVSETHLPDQAAFESGLKEIRAHIAWPTYARYEASTIGKTGKPPKSDGGRGPAFGTLIHTLLRRAVESPEADIEALATALLLRDPIDGVTPAVVMQMIDAARSHELWRRIMQAERRMTEIPFALQHQPDDGLPGTLRGDIDLAILDDGIWTLIDYKTDVTGDRLDEFTTYYSPQLRVYCDAWQRLTGSKAHGVLWFLDIGIAINMK
jgi:ATP-dependent helicase/nuclease subunit A